MKDSTLLYIGAVVAGVILLSKKQSVSGIGATNTNLALQLIEQAGIDINKDFYVLSWSDVMELTRIMKIVKYKAPDGRHRSGSPARYFWYYMQRVAGRN